MRSNVDPLLPNPRSTAAMIVNRQSVKPCHIYLPDMPKPVGAILYQERLYSYVRSYSTLEAAQRGVDRLVQKGNLTVLTQVPKGLILWVFEPDAWLA